MPKNLEANYHSREEMEIVEFVHGEEFVDICVRQETLQVLGFAHEDKDVEWVIAIGRETGQRQKYY